MPHPLAGQIKTWERRADGHKAVGLSYDSQIDAAQNEVTQLASEQQQHFIQEKAARDVAAQLKQLVS